MSSKASGSPEEECQSSNPDWFPIAFLEEMVAELDFEGKGGVGLGNEKQGSTSPLVWPGARVGSGPAHSGAGMAVEFLAGLSGQYGCLDGGKGAAEPACR